jgi:hypothetical protein
MRCNRFNGFGRERGKPLKRLGRPAGDVHRAEAALNEDRRLACTTLCPDLVCLQEVLVPALPIPARLSGREHRQCGPSTATRLCNKAQGWTEGTTLGNGGGAALNPNGVVAGGQRRRLVFRPPGRNPVGVEEHRRAITQGWRRANPGLCCTTPLGLERVRLYLSGPFHKYGDVGGEGLFPQARREHRAYPQRSVRCEQRSLREKEPPNTLPYLRSGPLSVTRVGFAAVGSFRVGCRCTTTWTTWNQ